MAHNEEFYRSSIWQDFTREVKQTIAQKQRPAKETILDDVDLCTMLKCSKRKTAELRANKEIAYAKTGKIYYLLSDVLDYIDRNRIEADSPSLNNRFK